MQLSNFKSALALGAAIFTLSVGGAFAAQYLTRLGQPLDHGSRNFKISVVQSLAQLRQDVLQLSRRLRG